MYAEHFGFSKLPFSLTPDPQVFFDNPLYREAFAKLQHGVLAKKGFVLITGEFGTGKTTLLQKLLHWLGPTVHCVLVPDAHVGFLELLRLILDDLNLLAGENDNKPAMIETLNQYLIERSRQGHSVALVIDEAQNLSEEALEGLRLLAKLKTDSEKLLQIILIGQPELDVRLDHPKLRPVKQRITIQCRLAPLKKEEVAAYIEFRLNAAGFRGQNPFQRASLEAIAFYSKGIPRLVNSICDNALLAAYAASKAEVSAQMVEEVARDLQLGPPRPTEARHPVSHKILDNRIEPRMQGARRPEFENVFIGGKKQHRPEFQRKRAGLAVGIFLGAVFLGGIAVSYSQQSKIYFSDLSARWEDFSRESRNYFSDSTVKVKDFFERTPARMREAVRSHWKNLTQVKPVTNPSRDGLADSNDVDPSKRTQPLFGNPAEVAEQPSVISQDLQESKQDNKVPVGITPAETQRAEDTGPLTESGAVSDNSNAQQTDSRQLASPRPETPALEVSNEGQTPYSGNFEVVAKSFVRDTPESDAEIITTLKPGTLVRVERKTGKYFDVRSLNDPRVHGYVHQEDAFFKRIK
jgi:type II secretory pathway predicted ATPase ExeA